MEYRQDKILLPRRMEFIGIGIFTILMSGIGVYYLAGFLPLEEGHTAADAVGAAVICLWTLLTLSLGVTCLLFNMKQVVLDNSGVYCKGLFAKKRLAWGEIREYGLSYSGQTRFIGNTYMLYFAVKEQKEKGKYKKQLRGDMIKMFILGGEYTEMTDKVFPFCQKRTKAACFIPEDRYHLF